jgi:hypothetical protein
MEPVSAAASEDQIMPIPGKNLGASPPNPRSCTRNQDYFLRICHVNFISVRQRNLSHIPQSSENATCNNRRPEPKARSTTPKKQTKSVNLFQDGTPH